jgi:hypothetical protein
MNFESTHNAVSKQEKKQSPEQAHEKLQQLLGEMSNEINAELAPLLSEKLHSVVDEHGAIRDDIFAKEHGGPLTSERIREYRAFVRTRERDWSGADDEKIQKYYRDVRGATNEEELIAAWKTERNKHDGALAEKAITILMYQFLKDEFFVLRTNTYDDYAHGIDNLIIEKSTGAVVCTFDEFIGSVDDERFQKKLTRERKQAQKQGATIEYGLGLVRGENGASYFECTAVRHVPTFTLPIQKEELSGLIQSLGDTVDRTSEGAHISLFSHIATSLAEQARTYMDELPEHSPVRARVVEFMSALTRIQMLGQTI